MHIDRDDQSAKVWLDPDVRVADNHGYSRKELRAIEDLTRDNLELLRHEWDAFCRHSTPAT